MSRLRAEYSRIQSLWKLNNAKLDNYHIDIPVTTAAKGVLKASIYHVKAKTTCNAGLMSS